MKSYTSLITVITNKLIALVDSGTPPATIFNDVYNVPESKPTGYPCAFVIEKAGGGSILDTARNEREWQFEITLMQETSNAGKTPEQAAVIMRDIVDRVIDMFDQDPQLEVAAVQQCMKVRIVPVLIDYTIREQPFIFAKFIVACVDLVKNY